MILLSEEQRDTLDQLLRFILRLAGRHSFPAQKEYYVCLENILGLNYKTIQNTLYSKSRSINPKKFKCFCDNFLQITNDEQSKTNRNVELEKYMDLFQKVRLSIESINKSHNEEYLTTKQIPQVKNFKNTKSNDIPAANISLPKNFTNAFNDKQWYYYERNENHIGRKVIHFGNFVGIACDVTIESHDSEPWQGRGLYNKKEQVLIVISKNTGTGSDYTNILILVDKIKKNFNLCIGHTTYKHRKNLNVVTKCILLLNKDFGDTKRKTAKLLDLKSKEIEIPIKEFFKSRSLNRLSSPHKIEVYDLPTLQIWINQNQPGTQNVYEPLLGNYRVYYKRKPDETFITASLQIFEHNGILHAKFIRKIDKNESSIAEGKIHLDFESHIMTALLCEINNDQLISNEDDYNRKQTFILINLPDRATKKIDTLTGIATGARDSNQGSVSRLMVFVKLIEGKLPNGYNKRELESFFNYYKNQSWIRPPYSRKVPFIYDFNHLKAAREDSIKNYGENI